MMPNEGLPSTARPMKRPAGNGESGFFKNVQGHESCLSILKIGSCG